MRKKQAVSIVEDGRADPISIRYPREVVDSLDEIAKARHTTRTAVCVQLIRWALNHVPPEGRRP